MRRRAVGYCAATILLGSLILSLYAMRASAVAENATREPSSILRWPHYVNPLKEMPALFDEDVKALFLGEDRAFDARMPLEAQLVKTLRRITEKGVPVSLTQKALRVECLASNARGALVRTVCTRATQLRIVQEKSEVNYDAHGE